MSDPVTPRQVHEAAGLDDWRLVGETLCTYFRTGSFAAGARLVRTIGELPSVDRHEPDVDLRRGGVTVRLLTITPDYYGLTAADVELARRISAAARELDVPADPSAVQNLVVSIDALVIPEVLPFWRAVLGYRPRADTPDDELNDPHLHGPVFFFNQMDAARPQRNRIHLDVWVPLDQAEARVAAALAAGGHVVTDEHAPGWWVLADVEGNEACVATWVSSG
ncbi:MAG: Pterin-4-alpha-carbinolamine dehydratase [Streptosporangiales bacterium]|nr:Pterin-4-alpha-carbinolamine dehydratase [Streptosporangiales bacterium]